MVSLRLQLVKLANLVPVPRQCEDDILVRLHVLYVFYLHRFRRNVLNMSMNNILKFII